MKNKIFAPFKTVELPILWNIGYSNLDDIVEAGMALKFITRGGAFYTYGDQKVQGKAKMVELLGQDSKIKEKLEKEIQAKIKDMRLGKLVLDDDALEAVAEVMEEEAIEGLGE